MAVDGRTLLELEEAFWRAAGRRENYEEDLAADAVHLFPGFGVMSRSDVLDGVAAAEAWDSVEIEDPRVIELCPDAAALVYVARASRPSGAYEAAITSVYRARGDGWELVTHQQTPL